MTRASVCTSLLIGCIWAQAQTPLPIPDTLTGPLIQLALQEGTQEFHPGEVVATYGYNGDLLGPTLILQQGEPITLNVTNTLPDLTTTHWHGLHVSPANDGGPHSVILPNTTWSPSFTVMDRASTFWYHPHGHGLTDYQVSLGAAGMIIVRDAQEAALDLPRTYGVDDIPLILQTKAIVSGQVALHTGLDSVVLANGVRNAWKELPAQVVRLRCLNGSSERTFLLGFSNALQFHVIGTDGGLLAAPVTLNRLQLMPGERAELLVDLGGQQGQSFQLMSYGSELPDDIIGAEQVGNGMATLDGYDLNALNGADFALVTFAVGAPTGDGTLVVPTALVPTNAFNTADVDVTRPFNIEPESMGAMQMIEGPFEINGALMDMDVINEVVQLGSTEIWEFINNTMVGHPIHIHDIQFNILDRNGLPPEPWESGWKDVVFVPAMGSARVITRFDDFADPDMPYMYHCHLLMHEDEGMMGQFLVIDPNAVGELMTDQVGLTVWPQPYADGPLRLQAEGLEGRCTVALADALGRTVLLEQTVFSDGRGSIVLPVVAPGHYVLRITARGHVPLATTLIVQP
ncbi:MAG: multicopper oxidase domain-containing protein [Flavobacteriales bacterium]|nr:multicopper oxidase domain-containing protein [Flavobacteriales bacterium]